MMVKELESINSEIKRNNASNQRLRKRAADLETGISSYLQANNQPGFKYKGKKFVMEEKTSFRRQKKKDKEEEVTKLLKELGVRDTKTAYTRLQQAQKGEEVEVTKLKITTDKKKDTF